MEKRIVLIITACLLILLAGSTFCAKEHYEQSLPAVIAEPVTKDSDGSVVFPPEAIFSANGSPCVYRLVAEEGFFGSRRYYVKAVLVSVQEREDGMVAVRGLYKLDDPYVIAASAALTDGAEVIWEKSSLW